MVLRDPDLFFQKLDSTIAGSAAVISTQVRPDKGGEYAGEILKVERLEVSSLLYLPQSYYF